MKASNLVKTIFLAAALSSALAACGRQSNNKTKIGKGGRPSAEAAPSKPGTDGSSTTPLTPLAESESCAVPFEDFGPADGEREIKLTDLNNEDMMQLGEAFKGKPVVFRLKQTRYWSHHEHVPGEGQEKITQEMSGELDGASDQARVSCRTKSTSDATWRLGVPSAYSAAQNKAIEMRELTFVTGPNGVSAEVKTVVEEDSSTQKSESTECFENENKTQICPESVILRAADEKTLIIRARIKSLSNDSKSNAETRLLSIYEAEVDENASTTAADSQASDDDADSELDEDTVPAESDAP